MSTSPARPPLGRFEQRLLAELTNVVAERADAHAAAPPSATPPARRPAWRRPVVRLGAAAVAAAALAVGLSGMLGGTTSTPAYAVVRHQDGSVTVTVNDVADPGGLQRQLADNGVRNRVFVVKVEDLTSCHSGFKWAPGLFTAPADTPPARPSRGHVVGVFTIHPDKLPTGATAVIMIDKHSSPRQGTVMVAAMTHPHPCSPPALTPDQRAELTKTTPQGAPAK